MRVYLPATLSGLADALAAGSARELPAGGGFAVTPAMREWYASGDTEELEYVALTQAAAESVRLIAADAAIAPRRVVVAADVDESEILVADDGTRAARGRITVTRPVAFSRVAAVHVDHESAADAVRAAAQDPEDEFAVEEAADQELLWYATQEVDDLLRAIAQS
jgi:hypothetical protein